MTNAVKDGHGEAIGRSEGDITAFGAPCRPLDYKAMRIDVPAIYYSPWGVRISRISLA